MTDETDDHEIREVTPEELPSEAEMRLINPALVAAMRKVFAEYGYKLTPIVMLCGHRMGDGRATVGVVRNVDADMARSMMQFAARMDAEGDPSVVDREIINEYGGTAS